MEGRWLLTGVARLFLRAWAAQLSRKVEGHCRLHVQAASALFATTDGAGEALLISMRKYGGEAVLPPSVDVSRSWLVYRTGATFGAAPGCRLFRIIQEDGHLGSA